APYEADGIVPFVAENRSWHEENRTYWFSYLLGSVIVLFGLLIAGGWWRPELGILGGLLVTGMSLVTLSFLITTPETWVPALGGAHHGFPWLRGRARLVVKDAITLGGAGVTMADSARAWLAGRERAVPAQEEARAAA